MAYSRLSSTSVQQRWEEIIVRKSGKGAKGDLNVNALREGLNGMRAVCLRSFPEFLADVKMAAIPQGGGEPGVGVMEMCETVKCSVNS